MQLTVITATGQRNQLEVPFGQLNAADLQAAVARCLGVQAAGLRLVRAGQPLNEDSAVSKLKDGGEFRSAYSFRPIGRGCYASCTVSVVSQECASCSRCATNACRLSHLPAVTNALAVLLQPYARRLLLPLPDPMLCLP